ncbi:hypothetical protein BCR34DRAFT_279949 [Clohesyomyces aquaticus]|uniref:Secreted protein n=1 Tax=Clohesyomyces aquaticus TaxID=1231657 RepID=A0A1Y1ZSA6_9PLEO|nr:hypothetical protein BCR34DRAFT_279949 [Clohesyomyces aquaticus]
MFLFLHLSKVLPILANRTRAILAAVSRIASEETRMAFRGPSLWPPRQLLPMFLLEQLHLVLCQSSEYAYTRLYTMVICLTGPMGSHFEEAHERRLAACCTSVTRSPSRRAHVHTMAASRMRAEALSSVSSFDRPQQCPCPKVRCSLARATALFARFVRYRDWSSSHLPHLLHLAGRYHVKISSPQSHVHGIHGWLRLKEDTRRENSIEEMGLVGDRELSKHTPLWACPYIVDSRAVPMRSKKRPALLLCMKQRRVSQWRGHERRGLAVVAARVSLWSGVQVGKRPPERQTSRRMRAQQPARCASPARRA